MPSSEGKARQHAIATDIAALQRHCQSYPRQCKANMQKPTASCCRADEAFWSIGRAAGTQSSLVRRVQLRLGRTSSLKDVRTPNWRLLASNWSQWPPLPRGVVARLRSSRPASSPSGSHFCSSLPKSLATALLFASQKQSPSSRDVASTRVSVPRETSASVLRLVLAVFRPLGLQYQSTYSARWPPEISVSVVKEGPAARAAPFSGASLPVAGDGEPLLPAQARFGAP